MTGWASRPTGDALPVGPGAVLERDQFLGRVPGLIFYHVYLPNPSDLPRMPQANAARSHHRCAWGLPAVVRILL